MSDSIMFSGDSFVVLEADQPEQVLSPEELFEKLKAILSDRQSDLPRDLQRFDSVDAQAQHLMESSCELDVEPGQFLQWYVIRTEK